MTNKERREEQQAYEEELARHNAIGEYLRKKGKVFDTGDVTPPPLNVDGSLKKDDEDDND